MPEDNLCCNGGFKGFALAQCNAAKRATASSAAEAGGLPQKSGRAGLSGEARQSDGIEGNNQHFTLEPLTNFVFNPRNT